MTALKTTLALALTATVAAGTASCAKKPTQASESVIVPGEDATIDDYTAMLDQNEAALREIGIDVAFVPAEAGATPDAEPPQPTAGDAAREVREEAPEALSPPSPGDGVSPPGSFNGDCETLCDLSSATCDLQVRICVLAERHTDDPRYGNACKRATTDCATVELIADSSCECEY